MIAKVISGGQTGVDRAALDAAIELGLPHGGWCPRGRKAEDGKIPHRYQLTEATGDSYPERTRMNVEDADVTLLLFREPITPGSALTRDCCFKAGKPFVMVPIANTFTPDFAANIRKSLEGLGASVLNVAGPRESKAPGIYERAKAFLLEVLRPQPKREESNAQA